MFLKWIFFAENPFVKPELFQNKRYTIGLGVTFLVAFLIFAISFMPPLLFADVNNLSPFMIGALMFPPAIAAAVLGKRGGRLADEKGDLYLVMLAVVLIFLCYSFLFAFTGIPPVLIMLILMFGNVGATFIRVGMSNTISKTLPAKQTGIGMGFFTMFNFIAGAVATTVLGKLLDIGVSGFSLNPFLTNEMIVKYSNIFFILALMAALAGCLYVLTLAITLKKVRSAKNTNAGF
ncbi:MFS transporter [Evansella halocellulosilytica]|uniref:MFS transporter n=1 Tax=Evansella halocellulosilytica TaxID=2011013 RepID=UPI000BB8A403|nr:MFS transporter [Evansella halocellulosilytica]